MLHQTLLHYRLLNTLPPYPDCQSTCEQIPHSTPLHFKTYLHCYNNVNKVLIEMDDIKSRIINYIGRYIICPLFAVSGLKINKREQVVDLLSSGVRRVTNPTDAESDSHIALRVCLRHEETIHKTNKINLFQN